MSSSPISPSPRVLIVSRRTIRKNKFVDFVGEYHLDLIVRYGAVPVIVPRVAGVDLLLESYEPFHGVLLCEGEDIEPSLYGADDISGLTPEELEEVRKLHASDTAVDREKDSIELRLTKLCLEREVPFLGICRGSQVLNVSCGGTLYLDIEKELSPASKNAVVHLNYDNYDGHRHPVRILENTPLHSWYRESLDEARMEIMVNSYHHQGVKKLAERFVPMAFADDELIEGFYDPDAYNPEEGKFIMGLQFHPERMRRPGTDEFDYPGCPSAYHEFVKAVFAYQKKVDSATNARNVVKMDQEIENRRKLIVRSFFIARHIYAAKQDIPSCKEQELEPGTAEFEESSMALCLQQEKRLKQMRATVRNASSYQERLGMDGIKRDVLVRNAMERMSIEQLSEVLSSYHIMGQICSEVLERKLMTA